MGYTEIKWVGVATLLAGAAVVYLSVRGQGWYSRIMPWLGVSTGIIVFVVGSLFAYVGTTEGPLVRQEDQPTKEELSRPIPSFSFPLVSEEGQRSLQEYRGQVVLLNLWATGCGACVKELPDLNHLQEKYGKGGLVVVTLSTESPDHLAQFAERHSFSTVNGYIVDKEALPDPFRRAFRTMPTSYLIDREGYIREFVLGSRSFKEWEHKVTNIL